MKQRASELIAEIQLLINQYGDLEILNDSMEEVNVEYNDDDEDMEAVFLVS